MGQQGSKRSIETSVVFLHVATESTEGWACAEEKWHQQRNETEGLEYVMDNPTGGVWVKSTERWTRY
ncbi:unnamed protein product [Knipowitschia caucasica]|uniref:Uncharacterized protein n=1 Tax=Knipowitschia caucasica TaxID=637954 RepID=A0AAV2JU09_KNICA